LRRVSLRRTGSLAEEKLFSVFATEEHRRGRFWPATATALPSSMSTSWLAAVAFPLDNGKLAAAKLSRKDLMMNAQGVE
jgi:hypothetical protein